ncbi:uncharacterized protein BDR25DRAFT_362700 [Lindgomyces ingoldianus]|uniref:Uncharacterized protein n=1 Tax=Lindgomyces ingoldianus TaxID=673940 RepID=A0ACB6Q9F0_9PLEO|nr:uncharacterized protein BDR25DRAFT_362700 [Lindgomyces ingoldianus]KAF2463532.1 hypothetical protein BDR25DRAFT_362700 [Lindgomyces ingoldianus]
MKYSRNPTVTPPVLQQLGLQHMIHRSRSDTPDSKTGAVKCRENWTGTAKDWYKIISSMCSSTTKTKGKILRAELTRATSDRTTLDIVEASTEMKSTDHLGLCNNYEEASTGRCYRDLAIIAHIQRTLSSIHDMGVPLALCLNICNTLAIHGMVLRNHLPDPPDLRNGMSGERTYHRTENCGKVHTQLQEDKTLYTSFIRKAIPWLVSQLRQEALPTYRSTGAQRQHLQGKWYTSRFIVGVNCSWRTTRISKLHHCQQDHITDEAGGCWDTRRTTYPKMSAPRPIYTLAGIRNGVETSGQTSAKADYTGVGNQNQGPKGITYEDLIAGDENITADVQLEDPQKILTRALGPLSLVSNIKFKIDGKESLGHNNEICQGCWEFIIEVVRFKTWKGAYVHAGLHSVSVPPKWSLWGIGSCSLVINRAPQPSTPEAATIAPPAIPWQNSPTLLPACEHMFWLLCRLILHYYSNSVQGIGTYQTSRPQTNTPNYSETLHQYPIQADSIQPTNISPLTLSHPVSQHPPLSLPPHVRSRHLTQASSSRISSRIPPLTDPCHRRRNKSKLYERVSSAASLADMQWGKALDLNFKSTWSRMVAREFSVHRGAKGGFSIMPPLSIRDLKPTLKKIEVANYLNTLEATGNCTTNDSPPKIMERGPRSFHNLTHCYGNESKTLEIRAIGRELKMRCVLKRQEIMVGLNGLARRMGARMMRTIEKMTEKTAERDRQEDKAILQAAYRRKCNCKVDRMTPTQNETDG